MLNLTAGLEENLHKNYPLRVQFKLTTAHFFLHEQKEMARILLVATVGDKYKKQKISPRHRRGEKCV